MALPGGGLIEDRSGGGWQTRSQTLDGWQTGVDDDAVVDNEEKPATPPIARSKAPNGAGKRRHRATRAASEEFEKNRISREGFRRLPVMPVVAFDGLDTLGQCVRQRGFYLGRENAVEIEVAQDRQGNAKHRNTGPNP